ncbi:MAG: DUF2069 domain-containing protein [SAR86 cluster bacterium]|uniref:DUF2069 domain-containing protein n=1 Tax=SAR86 cluster bacterium TaxID=2030880 RepID=A0A520N4B9_9GAMM|nr:MAG: DUF2069 domain-containing protein [SAR86 cluster bacterium]
MISIANYKLLTNLLFMCLFISKFINVIQERIDIFMYIFWALPIFIFYMFINKLVIKAYQWFCFLLIIYFLLSSLRVFGTSAYWLDILELFFISSLFISIMYGPRIINNMN